MQTRAATAADLTAIAALQQRWDTAWFGAAELDEGEVGESFGRVDPLESHSRVVVDGSKVIAAAWWWGSSSTLAVDPAVDAAPILAELVPWFERQNGPNIEVLSRDEQLVDAVTARGWRHLHSSFELIRPVTSDWVLAAPQWPDGVAAGVLRPADLAAVHRLIYVDAGWAEVPGHPHRGFDEWRSLFVTADTVPDQQVLAWQGDRLAGVAVGRTYSDGTGWVSQLAVAKSDRGRGLGRALLLEAMRRRVAVGATALGLSVQAENRAALALYVGVGLRIVREWQEFARPS